MVGPSDPGLPVLPPEVELAPRSNFRFAPGEVASQATLIIRNRSRLIERYDIRVEGLPEEWYSLSSTEMALEPGANTQISLRFQPRLAPGTPAGDHEFRINVAPRSFPQSLATVGGVISITGVTSFDARLTPQQTSGRLEKFKLTLRNTGGLPLSLWLEASDPEGFCKFRYPPPVDLAPGEEGVVPVMVGARRNGLVGDPKRYNFVLRVSPAGAFAGAAKSFDARFVHQPFLTPRMLQGAALITLITSIIGLVFVLGTSRVSHAVTSVRCGFEDEVVLAADKRVRIKEECGGGSIADQTRFLRLTPTVSPTANARATASPGAATATPPAPSTTPPPSLKRTLPVNQSLTNASRLTITLETIEVQEDGKVQFNMRLQNAGGPTEWWEDATGAAYVQDAAGTRHIPQAWGAPEGPLALDQRVQIPNGADRRFYVIYPRFDVDKPFTLQDEVTFRDLTAAAPTVPTGQPTTVPAATATPRPVVTPTPSPRPNVVPTTAQNNPAPQAPAPQAPAPGPIRSDPPPAVIILPPPPPSALSPEGSALINLVNGYRTASGRVALSPNANLTNAANAYAKYMAEARFFSHTGLDGSSDTDRARAANYGGYVGETIAGGQTTPQAVLLEWQKSPLHNTILLDAAYIDVSVGHFFRLGNGLEIEHYWVLMAGFP